MQQPPKPVRGVLWRSSLQRLSGEYDSLQSLSGTCDSLQSLSGTCGGAAASRTCVRDVWQSAGPVSGTCGRQVQRGLLCAVATAAATWHNQLSLSLQPDQVLKLQWSASAAAEDWRALVAAAADSPIEVICNSHREVDCHRHSLRRPPQGRGSRQSQADGGAFARMRLSEGGSPALRLTVGVTALPQALTLGYY